MTPNEDVWTDTNNTRNIQQTLPIATDVPLGNYSTMRLGGKAAYATEINSRQDIPQAYHWANEHQLPCITIGSGSNIVWRDEGFTGLLLVNRLKGFKIVPENTVQSAPAKTSYDTTAGSPRTALVTIGGGENWDKAVERCVQAGLSGVESLSLIPGTAGATPVQNVGAYGQEIADTLVSIEAYDSKTGTFIHIPAADCAFGYRTSRFKASDRGRFFICSITLRLNYANPKPPFYNALQKYLDEHRITAYTPAVLREAVIAIRSSKLPDPNTVANNGSFFANPIVDQASYERIAAAFAKRNANATGTVPDPMTQTQNPQNTTEIPHWPTSDGRIKIPAAWLIEQAGFKDFHDPETGMATWHKQPLVLVNERASSTRDLLAFREKIISTVQREFGITLEQEPELLPQE